MTEEERARRAHKARAYEDRIKAIAAKQIQAQWRGKHSRNKRSSQYTRKESDELFKSIDRDGDG
jgi:hypothetical protein